MWTITKLNGQNCLVGRGYLDRLIMLMDWQITAMGYTPESVNAAARKIEVLNKPQLIYSSEG